MDRRTEADYIVSPLGMARMDELPMGQVTLQKATRLVLLVTTLSLRGQCWSEKQQLE